MTPSTAEPADIELQQTDVDPVAEFLSQHQTAMLVVMFTDLKGSTDLAEQRGEVHSQNVRLRHDALLRSIVERDGAGRCIKNIGDALMCIFAQPSLAVDRALEIQRELMAYNAAYPGDEPLRVRIGMHVGQVVLEDEVQPDVFGRHVNRAARVEALADAGQILLTFPVYDSAKGWLSEKGHAWQDHGYYQLKGIDEPTRIFEVYQKGGQGPRTPQGNRVRRRTWIAWAVAAAALVAAGAAGWYATRVEPELQPQLDVRVLRHGEVFVNLAEALPLETGDQLQLVGSLNRPAYAALIWIDQQGVALVMSSSGNERAKTVRDPKKQDEWVTLEGGAGTDMAILVVDEKERRANVLTRIGELFELNGLPKIDDPYSIAAVWGDRKGVTEMTASSRREEPRGLGAVQRQEVDELHYQVDRVREVLMQDVSNFQAVAFPHK